MDRTQETLLANAILCTPKALSIAKKIRLSDFQSQNLQTSGICRGLILQFLSRAEYIVASASAEGEIMTCEGVS